MLGRAPDDRPAVAVRSNGELAETLRMLEALAPSAEVDSGLEILRWTIAERERNSMPSDRPAK
jgi:hypothetical protein